MSSFLNYSINNLTKPFYQENNLMDNKKFEQLIDLIINENEDQARALFHDIVVEKSREIYENIIAEELEEAGMGGQVGDLLDEIGAEESGVIEGDDEEEFDISDDAGEEEVVDFEAGEGEDEEGEGDLEDRVVDLEDKLDQLMAEFEEIMGTEEAEHGEDFSGDGEIDGEEGEEDLGGDEMMEAADDEEEEEEDTLEESITLKKVSVTHGDNGQNTKSTVTANSGARGMASKPVKFAGDTETMPNSPKGPSNAYSKGETQVKHAAQWKNAPAQSGQNLEKAPAPKKGDDGQNTKSPLGESKKVAKKRV